MKKLIGEVGKYVKHFFTSLNHFSKVSYHNFTNQTQRRALC